MGMGPEGCRTMGMNRDRGLEGLRGVACVAVMITHLALILLVTEGAGALSFGQRLVGEAVWLLTHGMTFFFVLSGYLLYKPFARHLLGGRRPSVRSFYRNRVLRVFPGYWFILAVCGWVLGGTVVKTSQEAEGQANLADSIGYLTDPLQILTNFTLTQGYTTKTVGGIPPSWSLVPEIAFYALLPLLFLAALQLGRRRLAQGPSVALALAPAALLIAVGVVGFEVSHHYLATVGDGKLFAETWPSRMAHSFLAIAELFGFGMAAAVIVTRLGNDPSPAVVRRIRRISAGIVVLAGLAYLPARILTQDLLVVGVAMAAVILLTVLPSEGRLARAWLAFAEWGPVERAGTISLSMYLWHYPVMLLALAWFPALAYTTWGGFLLAGIVIAPVIVVLSELTYRYVELPALSRKKTLVPTSETTVPATTPA